MFSKNKSKASLAAAILERAAELEREGAQFYAGMADTASDTEVKALAETMLRAEHRHEERFLHYARKAGHRAGGVAASSFPPEIDTLLSKSVFASGDRARRTAPHLNQEELLKVAIRAEENLALLYTQVRSFVTSEERPFIDRIIKEEWKHKEKLVSFLKQKFS